MQSARIVYRSTSGDNGALTTVSGAVFLPKGVAPSGGWPVISFGHGTTGLEQPCAPSLSGTLLGLSDVVASLVAGGYAVALADYQGLGSPGIHPYTDAKTAGLNMIDAVRALREAFGDVSTSWAAVGGSQGGGGAWAAAELAGSYAPDLTLVGALAISPAANVSGLVTKAENETLTPDQRPALQAVVESLARLHPSVNRDDYRSDVAAQGWDVLSACAGPLALERASVAQALGPGDIRPRSTAAANSLRAYLDTWALPQQRLSAPLLVWFGGADSIIDADWTSSAIRQQCSLGGTVQWKFEGEKGHGEVDLGGLMPWIADRFDSKPVTNDCT